uniref:Nicotinamide-nucleotide adenylyltransferase n=1 Tax=Syphacia muris TaxID=451379 RepID=A0A0N5AA60_9BILA
MSSLRGARVALIACGSFNPPTYMHLRMFECARDMLQQKYGCIVVEGIISPVSDHFPKIGLLPSKHRLRMAELAVRSSKWIRVDNWECAQNAWTRTVVVLQHFKKMLTQKTNSNNDNDTHLMLLCGGDVVDSFTKLTKSGDPLWEPKDITEIINDFGLVIIHRRDSEPKETLKKLEFVNQLLDNVYIFNDEVLPNDISSTRIRAAVKNGHSIKYCTDDAVIDYIVSNGLYRDDGNNDQTEDKKTESLVVER